LPAIWAHPLASSTVSAANKLARVRRDFNHSEASAKKAIQYHYSEHGKRSGKGGANNNGLNQGLHDYDLQTLLFLLRTALFADTRTQFS
jgi:hypothetical protein